MFHLAELYEAKGEPDRALDLVEGLRPQLGELSEALADQVTRMISRLQ